MFRKRHRFFRGPGFGEWAWRSSSSSMATQAHREKLPLLMVSCSSASSPESRCLYGLTKEYRYHMTNLERHPCQLTFPGISTDDYYLAGSSRGFLFFWPRSGGEIQAIHPFTGARFRLPPVTADPDFVPDPGRLDPNKMRIVLSPSLDTAILFREACSKSLELQFTRLPSSSSSHWTPFSLTGFIHRIEDCIFHKNRLFIVNRDYNLVAFDEYDFANYSPFTNDDHLPPATWPCDISPMKNVHIFRTYLVESPNGNNIFLLFRCCSREFRLPYKSIGWWVYKLDSKGRAWRPVKTIGDSAFFVGPGGAMSVPVRRDDSSVLEPDSIYFTDGHNSLIGLEEGLVDTGIYDMQYGTSMFFPVTDTGTILQYCPPVWLPPAAC